MLLRFVSGIFVLSLVSSLVSGTAEPTARGASQPKSSADVVALVSPAAVLIRAAMPNKSISSGSGFIVSESGTVVTNLHVVKGAERIELRLSNGDIYEVTGVRGIDERRDLAVLQVSGFKLPTLTLGDSDFVRPGDNILVIGNPLGMLENTVTAGVISGIRELEGYKLLQMDAAISKGNSGGPVVNAGGEVIGVTVAKLIGGESLNFAIPINYVRGMLHLEPKAGIDTIRAAEDKASVFGASTQQIPRRWKSVRTGVGSMWNVRFEGEYLYIEAILPEIFQTAGGFCVGELRKQGDKWVGEQRLRQPCQIKGSWGTPKSKLCFLQFQTEITLLTPSRIEGTVVAPSDSDQINCERCAYTEPPVSKSFVWIPE
jgi:hypothetical protein